MSVRDRVLLHICYRGVWARERSTPMFPEAKMTKIWQTDQASNHPDPEPEL